MAARDHSWGLLLIEYSMYLFQDAEHETPLEEPTEPNKYDIASTEHALYIGTVSEIGAVEVTVTWTQKLTRDAAGTILAPSGRVAFQSLTVPPLRPLTIDVGPDRVWIGIAREVGQFGVFEGIDVLERHHIQLSRNSPTLDVL